MVEHTKVYDNDISLQYRRADKTRLKKQKQVIEDDPKVFNDSRHDVGESKIDHLSSGSLKSQHIKRQLSRENLISSAKEIGDMRLVKILQEEERAEANKLKEDLFRAEANKILHGSIDRDLRRKDLDQKYEDELWEDL